MSTLQDSFTTPFNTGAACNASTKILAQTWTAATSYSCVSVQLYLRRYGTPGTINVSIKAVDGDNKPTGIALATGSTNGNTLVEDPNYEWREVTISPAVYMVAGNK